MRDTVIMLKLAFLLPVACLISSALCTEGNSVRYQRANLVPAAGGYGASDMEDNYDYILDDTPPRGIVINRMLYYSTKILIFCPPFQTCNHNIYTPYFDF